VSLLILGAVTVLDIQKSSRDASRPVCVTPSSESDVRLNIVGHDVKIETGDFVHPDIFYSFAPDGTARAPSEYGLLHYPTTIHGNQITWTSNSIIRSLLLYSNKKQYSVIYEVAGVRGRCQVLQGSVNDR